MFSELLESRPRPSRRGTQAVLSVAVHVVLIGAAVRLTTAVAAGRPAQPTSAMPLFHAAPPAPAPVVTEPAHSAAAASAAAFLAAPLTIPSGLPPIDIGDPRVELQRGGINPGALPGPPNLGAPPASEPRLAFTLNEVDQPAEYLRGPEPVFPPALRAAGMRGAVTLEFIIDSSGHVEPGSLQVIQSNNPAFDDAARAASTFRPGRIRGRVVRQLVEQSVLFGIRH
jgi:protein TonB